MGWGITYEGYISKVKIDDLENKHEELQDFLKHLKSELDMLSASSPHQVFYDNGSNMEWIDYIIHKTASLWRNIIETAKELAIIEQAINSDTKTENDA